MSVKGQIKPERQSNKTLLNNVLAHEIRYKEILNFYLTYQGVDGSEVLEKYLSDSIELQKEILRRMEGNKLEDYGNGRDFLIRSRSRGQTESFKDKRGNTYRLKTDVDQCLVLELIEKGE